MILVKKAKEIPKIQPEEIPPRNTNYKMVRRRRDDLHHDNENFNLIMPYYLAEMSDIVGFDTRYFAPPINVTITTDDPTNRYYYRYEIRSNLIYNCKSNRIYGFTKEYIIEEFLKLGISIGIDNDLIDFVGLLVLTKLALMLLNSKNPCGISPAERRKYISNTIKKIAPQIASFVQLKEGLGRKITPEDKKDLIESSFPGAVNKGDIIFKEHPLYTGEYWSISSFYDDEDRINFNVQSLSDIPRLAVMLRRNITKSTQSQTVTKIRHSIVDDTSSLVNEAIRVLEDEEHESVLMLRRMMQTRTKIKVASYKALSLLSAKLLTRYDPHDFVILPEDDKKTKKIKNDRRSIDVNLIITQAIVYYAYGDESRKRTIEMLVNVSKIDDERVATKYILDYVDSIIQLNVADISKDKLIDGKLSEPKGIVKKVVAFTKSLFQLSR